jgi:hypothetical protein|tara:strand:+ start:26 stop:247 length:222 start_codon:yes stop_codon:yes gene_type:complete
MNVKIENILCIKKILHDEKAIAGKIVTSKTCTDNELQRARMMIYLSKCVNKMIDEVLEVKDDKSATECHEEYC